MPEEGGVSCVLHRRLEALHRCGTGSASRPGHLGYGASGLCCFLHRPGFNADRGLLWRRAPALLLRPQQLHGPLPRRPPGVQQPEPRPGLRPRRTPAGARPGEAPGAAAAPAAVRPLPALAVLGPAGEPLAGAAGAARGRAVRRVPGAGDGLRGPDAAARDLLPGRGGPHGAAPGGRAAALLLRVPAAGRRRGAGRGGELQDAAGMVHPREALPGAAPAAVLPPPGVLRAAVARLRPRDRPAALRAGPGRSDLARVLGAGLEHPRHVVAAPGHGGAAPLQRPAPLRAPVLPHLADEGLLSRGQRCIRRADCPLPLDSCANFWCYTE
mmetsp:Transcript_14330/g.41804  ORF Transcript_14330/g.41804 Transcript_14330/m.41804 type:complete len:326 (-) Transcript_14330:845-1822(-)